MSAPDDIRQLVREEVRRALIEDPEVRRAIQAALRETPESRFDKLLEELRLAREEDSRRWAEHQAEEAKRWEEQKLRWDEQVKLWAEQNRRWAERQEEEAKRWEEQKLRWDEQAKLWAEQNRRWAERQEEEAKRWEEQKLRWDEQAKLWAEQNRRWAERQEEEAKRWEEQAKLWAEQNRRWAERQEEEAKRWEEQAKLWAEQNRRWAERQEEEAKRWEEENLRWKEDQKAIRAMLKRLDEFDSRLGALGARWGLHSEEAFRSALQGILEESFGVQVINLREWDDSGEVFGRPDQVELDVIIYNSTLILCEIKSAVSKADIALFERKVQWYEKRHSRKADRRIVISPLADARAERFARELGIEIYSFARDVPLTPSGDQ
jgi:hypothetical protein